MKRTRTRYAPSPTGYLHIGGARTALFAYLYAKHFNGDFVLRIEDTDRSRHVEDGEKSQLDNLMWLGIIPDEYPGKENPAYGAYRQSEKLVRYNQVIEKLLQEGNAYRAYETSEELNTQRGEQEANGIVSFRYNPEWLNLSEEEKSRRDESGEYCIRLKLPKDKYYNWKDIVRGKISINTDDIGDYVIKKQDGYPTYNFAVVVDDHDMEISHVLRGEEHITNTPKQLVIYDLMGWEAPEFGHLTIITNMAGKKLSKRDTDTKQFIEDYKNNGYVPHAIFNFLALLGWTSADAKEKMSKIDLIRKFDPARLSKSPSKFDIKKMDWFAKEYMRELDNEIIIEALDTDKDAAWLELFVDTYKQSAINVRALKEMLSIYEEEEEEEEESTVDYKNKLNEFEKVDELKAVFINNLKDFSIESIKEAINQVKEQTGLKGKGLFMPMRLIATHQEHGPELAKAIYLFGEEKIMARFK